MRILVTGGTGFTGTALVQRLLQEGHNVVVLDYKEGLQCDALRKRGAEVIIGSVTDPAAVERSMRGVEFVFHLAAAFRELNVPDSFYDEVNVGGTRVVLHAARRAGVRKFLYCSTCGVHGNVEHPPADEDAPIRPADYYQRTKYEAEPLVKQEAGDMEVVILRPAAIYGPGDPERFFMIFKRVAKGTFPMFGSGRTLYHPLYIDNLVDAFLLCMPQGVGSGREYLIADEKYYAIEDIVQAVARALDVPVRIPHYPVLPVVAVGHVVEKLCKPLGVTPPIFPRRVDWYRQNRAFDIGRAQRELGYRPLIELEEGLRRAGIWYREMGYL
ncbi:MAG TPA: NAD-dependent epimerase/dehydratase family protein [Chloroflexota bacterium]|nr:NAD-dependent epimerase/dehydratase family protein [Chloroflexota bacterium]